MKISPPALKSNRGYGFAPVDQIWGVLYGASIAECGDLNQDYLCASDSEMAFAAPVRSRSRQRLAYVGVPEKSLHLPVACCTLGLSFTKIIAKAPGELSRSPVGKLRRPWCQLKQHHPTLLRQYQKVTFINYK
ncbi:MAG TPA: hypothetical protein V6D12_23590 [Candidatus Obscuribacterales bacterium]